jgi:hypothetical protein
MGALSGFPSRSLRDAEMVQRVGPGLMEEGPLHLMVLFAYLAPALLEWPSWCIPVYT